MGKLRDVVKGYFEGQEQIFEAFDTSGWEEINSHIGEPWHRYESGDFTYLDSQDEVYSFETATQVGEVVDGLVLFYVQENGEKYYSLFEKDKEMTEAEAEEKLEY
jgi:hypothetical protein|tara:strand:- start:3135 stop:3449 length:315 start_codon:yes stop_codon:yes gene_type:complete